MLRRTPEAGVDRRSHSKFAALAATQSLALDLAAVESKLKVTALCPGMVQTNLAAQSLESRPT